jgi:hypothetical protein
MPSLAGGLSSFEFLLLAELNLAPLGYAIRRVEHDPQQ